MTAILIMKSYKNDSYRAYVKLEKFDFKFPNVEVSTSNTEITYRFQVLKHPVRSIRYAESTGNTIFTSIEEALEYLKEKEFYKITRTLTTDNLILDRIYLTKSSYYLFKEEAGHTSWEGSKYTFFPKIKMLAATLNEHGLFVGTSVKGDYYVRRHINLRKTAELEVHVIVEVIIEREYYTVTTSKIK